jgi:hypothetical protein
MLSEDYIMRMIGQAMAALMNALGLRKAGKYEDAMQSLDQALEGVLGLKPHIVDQLDDGMLINHLNRGGQHDIERMLLVADIYREKSALYRLKAQPADSLAAAGRSLRLYLEACLTDETSLTSELVRKIEPLRLELTAASLPLETRLALLDYLERMLARSDSFLAECALTRPALQQAFDSLNTITLV